ncbi:protein SPEAR2 [Cajanus cajan]|uniref:protein SPEAR2 n=1 Tax=Cajanus cajan TaxID=3821 RepID=UPI00098DB365|nr:protein SPEAR2 [Cajanus cajan]
MGQEDGTQKFNRIGGGRRGVGRPSKGPKPKKVPQRGLGVAQLEKLRLEEEKTNAANAISSSPTNSPYDFHLQIPNLLRSNQPSSPNSLPSSTVSLVNTSGGGPHDLEFEKNNFGLDSGLALAKVLPCDSNPIRPFPNWVQRSQQQYQQHHPPSSMVSVSSETSSTTLPHSSTEPPSNQNYSLSYVSKRQEEKMKGVKRPNPFSLDIPPVSYSDFKLLTSAAPLKASETISCGSGREFNLDFGNSTLREVLSPSASNSKLILKKSKKENNNFGGDFLRLAPPTPCLNSKLKSPSTSLAFLPQGNMVDQVPSPSGYNQQQQQWYNFLPPAAKVVQIGQESDRFQDCNAVGETIDLNLKL